MLNHENLASLIASCNGLTQTQLAEYACVNRGQLNHWLKNGTNLAEDKVVAVIAALLRWLKENQPDYETRHGQVLAEIAAYAPYQAAQATSFPDQPVPPGHATYIKRNIEDRLARLFDLQPADVAIIGGPKLGKSSVLGWLQQYLRFKHNVVRCTFLKNGADPLRAIEQAVKALAPKTLKLRDWTELPDWLRRTLLSDGKPCTLLFDDIDVLSGDHLNELEDGLHYLVNRRRVEPVLEKLSLVVAHDDGATALLYAQHYSSGLSREFRTVALPCFSEIEVESLIEAVLVRADQKEVEVLAETAWSHFRGHPYFTHRWTTALSDPKRQASSQDVPQDVTDDARVKLFRPFLEIVNKADSNLHQTITGSPEDFFISPESNPISSAAKLWLQDSGLFVVDGLGKGAKIRFATPWIREQLRDANKV